MNYEYLADHEEAIPLIAKWYYNEWGRGNEEISLVEVRLKLKKYLNRNKIPLLILAMENGEIRGTVQLKYYEMDIYPEKKYWLGGVFVSPEYRGQRIGISLVKKASCIARSLDIHILHLQTEKMDGGLYSKLGWKPVEKAYYRDKNVLVMKRILKS